MRLKIKEVAILDSKVGNGLKIGKYTFGCARITKVDLDEGITLRDCALEGLSVGYKPVQVDLSTAADGEKTPAASRLTSMELITDTLDAPGANNYALFYADNETGDTSIIHDTGDLVELFNLPESDAAELDKYIGMLAEQRNLELVRYVDIEDDKEAIIFVNQFDREIVESVLDDDAVAAGASYMNMLRSPEFRTDLETHNFIKLMVISVAQTGQDRYNKLNRDDVLAEMAKTFSSIRYWKDGELRVPSVKDINDYMDQIKEQIRIQ